MPTVRPQSVFSCGSVVLVALLLGAGCADQPPTAPAAGRPVFGKGGTGRGGSATIIEVALPLSTWAKAVDINESGQVVGLESGGPVVLWTPDSPRGTTGSLAPLTPFSWVGEINDASQVLVSEVFFGAQMVWDGGHTLTLPVPPQADPARPNTAWAWNLSDHSAPADVFWAVGSCNNAEDEESPCFGGRAIVWWMTGTGPLMSVTATDFLPDGSGAIAASRSGVVAGGDSRGMPAKWIPDAPGNWTRVTLELPAGSREAHVRAVNAHGATVGYYPSRTKGNVLCYSAVLWPAGSTSPFSLPMAGYDCSWAEDINDAGYIVGYGFKWPYTYHAVLWMPRATAGYEMSQLVGSANSVYSSAVSLNELAMEADGSTWAEVIGWKGQDCYGCTPVLWKVQVP